MTLKDRKQIRKENRITAILLTMLLVSLILLSAAFSDGFGAGEKTVEKAVIPTSEDIGRTVYVEGTVQDFRRTYTGGHLVIELVCDDMTTIPVFVAKSAGASDAAGMLAAGKRIGVRGTVKEYKGALELVVRDKDDIVVTGA